MSTTTPSAAVFLTATISPSAVMTATHRSDPELRRRDYRQALARYCSSLDPTRVRLFLIENSGADLADLKAVAEAQGHDLGVISYTESDAVSARGKGAGEARMFDLIGQRASPYRVVCKVTGRLYVKNLSRLLNTSHEDSVSCLVRKDLSWVDTRVIISDSLTWQKHFASFSVEIDERSGHDLERVFLNRLVEATTLHRLKFRPFVQEPVVIGTSGSYGGNYSTIKSVLVRPLKNVIRRVPAGPFL